MDEIYVTDYRDVPELREQFFELPLEMFGIDLRSWYEAGLWNDDYHCHSIMADGQIVANVSTSRFDMYIGGKIVAARQIGTVCTLEEYRGRGYIREILRHIYEETDTGLLLYGNDTVREFYPKLGFERGPEESRPIINISKYAPEKYTKNAGEFVRGGSAELQTAVRAHAVISPTFDVKPTETLTMFYAMLGYGEQVYVNNTLNVTMIANIEDETPEIKLLLAPQAPDPELLVSALAKLIPGKEEAALDCMPDGFGLDCEWRSLTREDATLFVKNISLPKHHFIIPELTIA